MTTQYIRTPDDSQRSASSAAVHDRFPGTHEGQVSAWIPIGPASVFERFSDLKTIVSNRLEISIDTYESGGDTVLHDHPEREQAYYVIAGQARIMIGDEQRDVGPGAVGYMAAGVKHGFKVLGDEGLVMMVISAYS